MSTSKKLKSLIRNRDSVLEFMDRIEQYLKNTKEFDEQSVNIRLEKLEQKWNDFEDLQNDIESMEDNEENMPEHHQLRAEFERKYFERMFSTATSTSVSKFRPTKVSVNSATETKSPNCFACKENHWITQCPTFANLGVDKRLQLTNSKRLCSNCLGRNHLARDCPSKYRCRTCSKKHHTLLHPGFPGSGSTVLATNENGNPSTSSSNGGASNSGESVSSSMALISSNSAIGHSKSHIFLLTVLLNVKDVWGRIHQARALLDSGSQANLMSANLCKLLQLSRRDKKVEITGIGRSRNRTAYEVSTTISSRTENFSTSMEFLVLEQLTENQPSYSIPMREWQPPADMVLADPGFNVSGPIDLVLGTQYFYEFHISDGGRLQARKFDNTLPVFVNTVFGWVAAGEVTCMEGQSREEEDYETHFLNRVSRDDTGRYILMYSKDMIFDSMMIGESKQMALLRFHHTERRLKLNCGLRSQYSDFMMEYIELGNMKYIGLADDSSLDEGKTVCYLPHHPVFKETSSTTKIRVVSNGSEKTSTNLLFKKNYLN
ncbi:uncharacterized protein LOC134221550 [Armigeres subalbatus]|uniref:uncharacterized protein LOC134221550 n=1 Tax=Armigeres subalbatus TaxID=124917 RepID=UPI002ED5D811